ncbi:MAG: hypothetical protein GX667_09615 [Xanthomonadaceae bacterium]|nr:hypothetical protein [Xanthomonadaceae bacterium]
MKNKQAMIQKARSLIGVKWRHRGRKDWAVDCIGLLVLSFKAGGYTLNDRTNYSRDPWNEQLYHELAFHFGEGLPPDEMQEGDIALMKWDSQNEPSHVGIITNPPSGGFSLIHSYSEISVTEHRIDDEWRERITTIFRPDWN